MTGDVGKSADAGPLPRCALYALRDQGRPLKDVCIMAGVQMAADSLQRLDRQARVENGH